MEGGEEATVGLAAEDSNFDGSTNGSGTSYADEGGAATEAGSLSGLGVTGGNRYMGG